MDKKYYDLDTIRETIWNKKLVDWEYGDVDPESIMFALEFYTPTADVRENKHGKWIFDDFDDDRFPYQCSECEAWARTNHNFCPNCGADMRGNNG